MNRKSNFKNKLSENSTPFEKSYAMSRQDKNNIKPYKNFIDVNFKDEHTTEDFDVKDGWDWKEMAHLNEMGFMYEGDTRLKLCDKKNIDDTLNVEIYKMKEGPLKNSYIMDMNGRKHVYRTFNAMLEMIEKLGKVE
jgi:hypothetical protein